MAAAVGLTLGRNSTPVDTSEDVAQKVTSTTTSAPTTTLATTTTATPARPTTTAASPAGVEGEPAGLYCRDLADKGYSYPDAVEYWENEGRPARMDATGSGIPCSTVYSAAEVEAYWGELPDTQACPTSDELVAVLDPSITSVINVTSGFAVIRCGDSWVVAQSIPPDSEGGFVYFRDDGELRAVTYGLGDECYEVLAESSARAQLCP